MWWYFEVGPFGKQLDEGRALTNDISALVRAPGGPPGPSTM